MLNIVSLCLPWNGQVSFSRIGGIGESQGLELNIFITVIPRLSSLLKEVNFGSSPYLPCHSTATNDCKSGKQ